MKKLNTAISFLLTVVLVFSIFGATLTASAVVTYKYGDFRYYRDGEFAVIVECDKSASGTVTVPYKINGYIVGLVSVETFYGCNKITSIVVEKGVQNFNAELRDCSSLTYLSIPASTKVLLTASPSSNCSEITLSAKETIVKFNESKKTATVNITSDLVDFSRFDDFVGFCTKVDKINVDKNNKNFTVVDGVLYDTDVTTFYLYPSASPNKSYVMPDTVQYDLDTAPWLTYLPFATNLESITLGKNFNLLCEVIECYEDAYAEFVNVLGEKFAAMAIALIYFNDDLLTHVFPYAKNLKEINVSPEHGYLTSKDGVLCLKDDNFDIILAYPGSKPGDITFDDNDIVTMYAYMGLQGDKKLTIGDKFLDNYFEFYEEGFRAFEIEDEYDIEASALGYMEDILYHTPVSEFYVSQNNPYYSVDENGILYNKDKTELVKFPTRSGIKDWDIPATLAIDADDFMCVNVNFKDISFPKDATMHLRGLDLDNAGMPCCETLVLCVEKDDNVYFAGDSMSYEEFVGKYNTEVNAGREGYFAEKAEYDNLYLAGKLADFEYEYICNYLFMSYGMYMPVIEFCEETEHRIKPISIREPSRTTIRYGDGIILYAELTEELPEGTRIEWYTDNQNFEGVCSDDGTRCGLVSVRNGYTIVKVAIQDADDNILAIDSIKMYSKAGFFDKIGGFFRMLFGTTKIYEQ